MVLDPISDSPLLQRLGLTENVFTKLGQHLTMVSLLHFNVWIQINVLVGGVGESASVAAAAPDESAED